MGSALRVCTQHDVPAIVDEERDRVICPGKGEQKEHRLRPGQWTVRTPGAALSGDALVMAAARAAIQKARGDQAAAATLLVDQARTDVRLDLALLEDAAGRAIARATGRYVQNPELVGGTSRETRAPNAVPRRPAEPTPSRPRSNTDRGLQLLAASHLVDLLEQELLPGVQLKDATGLQVLEAAELEAASARTGIVRARWLRMIAARVPSGRRVAQVLEERHVVDLHLRAEADLAAVLAAATKRITSRVGVRAIEERSE